MNMNSKVLLNAWRVRGVTRVATWGYVIINSFSSFQLRRAEAPNHRTTEPPPTMSNPLLQRWARCTRGIE